MNRKIKHSLIQLFLLIFFSQQALCACLEHQQLTSDAQYAEQSAVVFVSNDELVHKACHVVKASSPQVNSSSAQYSDCELECEQTDSVTTAFPVKSDHQFADAFVSYSPHPSISRSVSVGGYFLDLWHKPSTSNTLVQQKIKLLI